MALRLRGKQSNRIELGEDDWLEVRPELTKREFRDLIKTLPDDFGQEGTRMSYGQSENFLEVVFEKLVTGWSVVDDDGKPVPATLDNLLELGTSASNIIEKALMEHFNGQGVDEETTTKSDEPSPESGDGEQRKADAGEQS